MATDLSTLLEKYNSIVLSKRRLAQLIPMINSEERKLILLDNQLQLKYNSILHKEDIENSQEGQITRINSNENLSEDYLKLLNQYRDLSKSLKVLKYEQDLLTQRCDELSMIETQIETIVHNTTEIEDKAFKTLYSQYAIQAKELHHIEQEIRRLKSVCEEIKDRLFLVYNSNTARTKKELSEHIKNLIALLDSEVSNLVRDTEITRISETFKQGIKYRLRKSRLKTYLLKEPLITSREDAKRMQVYFTDLNETFKSINSMVISEMSQTEQDIQSLLLGE